MNRAGSSKSNTKVAPRFRLANADRIAAVTSISTAWLPVAVVTAIEVAGTVWLNESLAVTVKSPSAGPSLAVPRMRTFRLVVASPRSRTHWVWAGWPSVTNSTGVIKFGCG